MADPGPANDAPNWETLAVELHCPRCGYDLRLLPQPRCPECGLEFRWGEVVTAAQQRLRSPLFEYQWRHRPVRSFFGTLGRAMLPWTLWRETRVALEPRLAPLLVFVTLVLILHAAVCLGVECSSGKFMRWWYSGHWISPRMLSGRFISARNHLLAMLGALLLAALSYVVLQVFHQTINRYRIRWQHFLRILVLSGAALVVWRATLVVAFSLYSVALNTGRWPWWMPAWAIYLAWPLWLIDLLPMCVFALAVSAGMSRYLQVRRGWAIGFMSIVIVLLVLITPVPVIIVLRRQPDHLWFDVLANLWPGLADLVWYSLVC